MPDPREVMNHLTFGRHLERRLPPRMVLPSMPLITHIQDCYFDYERADSSVVIEIHELLADPYIVSRITTGYSGRSHGSASEVLVISG
jgi:hypothetical protein